MIRNENIICVSNTTWEGFYTKSTVQIMSLLAKENKVLFVEYPFTLKDLVFAWLGKNMAPAARMTGWNDRLKKKHTAFGSEVFHLVAPPVLPVEFIKYRPLYNLLFRLNARIYARSVRNAMKKLNMSQPVIINAYQAIYGNRLIGKFREKLNIFYCYDGPDIRRYGPSAVTNDRTFAQKADVVIVTSAFLGTSMKDLNKNVQVVKNGVDFPMFNKQAKQEPKPPAAKRRVGYIGSLDHRFDIDAVEYAIQNLPDYDFEFVGDLMNKSIEERLSKYPNVEFKPPVKPDEVPALLSKCDVGLIPYLCTDYTKNIYPLKINEYLAVGVPVVLTAFADLPEFNAIVRFAGIRFHSARPYVRKSITTASKI
jgi:teichuronic acid biosynthesis glycosyltransferase TuaH